MPPAEPHDSGLRGRTSGLLGRRGECAVLDQLIDAVRAGKSRVRTARLLLEDMGMEAFAERARRELRATGETGLTRAVPAGRADPPPPGAAAGRPDPGQLRCALAEASAAQPA